MKKRFSVAIAVAICLMVGGTAVYASEQKNAESQHNVPDNLNTLLVQKATNNIESRMLEYNKVGISFNKHDELMHDGELVRNLSDQTQEESYRYSNEDGEVNLIVTQSTTKNDGKSSNLNVTLTVTKLTNEEFASTQKTSPYLVPGGLSTNQPAIDGLTEDVGEVVIQPTIDGLVEDVGELAPQPTIDGLTEDVGNISELEFWTVSEFEEHIEDLRDYNRELLLKGK